MTGTVVSGEERIASKELFERLGIPYSDRAARRLRRVMRRLGWRPRKLRFGSETRNGYCRKPGAVVAVIEQAPALPSAPRADENPTAERLTARDMAGELAAVAQLGLKTLRDILTVPLDYGDGPLLRAKNAAANTALNTQIRADENRLRERARMAPWSG